MRLSSDRLRPKLWLILLLHRFLLFFFFFLFLPQMNKFTNDCPRQKTGARANGRTNTGVPRRSSGKSSNSSTNRRARYTTGFTFGKCRAAIQNER